MFKNTFGVTGSRKQLEAFAEWAEGIGWVQVYNHDGDFLYFNSKDGRYNYGHRNITTLKEFYSLPTQYAEAIAAAREKEEVKFEVGKKYKAEQGFVVLCTSPKGQKEDEFSGVVIQGELWPLGDYSNRWVEKYFTPYPDPITI